MRLTGLQKILWAAAGLALLGYGALLLVAEPTPAPLAEAPFRPNFTLPDADGRLRSSADFAGKHTLVFDFAYDGGGLSKGGMGTLLVDGEKVGEGRIGVTQAGLFSADETADVGIDLGTPVVEAIGAEAKSRFAGRIPKLTVEVK